MTFVELAEKVLRETNKAMTPNEIWYYAVANGYEKAVDSKGATPWLTLGSRVGDAIRKDKTKSKFARTATKPLKYFLVDGTTATVTNKSKSKSNRKKAEFVRWMNPILLALKSMGGSGTASQVTEWISEHENVSEEDLSRTSKTGVPIFKNQVAWARQYLVWEQLLGSSKRGIWSLTERGFQANLSYEEARNIFLKWVEFFAEARKNKAKADDVEEIIEDQENRDPEQDSIGLLTVLQRLSPEGFERICRRLLNESGFQNVEVTQVTRDGGIDGYGDLQITPFVKLSVAFQCKRYATDTPVRFDDIAKFRGVTQGRYEKAILITTSRFTLDAIKAAAEKHYPIELIDGEKLVTLFEQVELGVTPKTVYEVDLNFFQPYMGKS